MSEVTPDAEPMFTHCPKCHTELLDAPGIGQFCPNKACDVVDGILVAAGLAPPFVIRQPDRAESAVAVMRAAALLRSLGWSVIAPVDPRAAIPEPEVGQVWRTVKSRVEPRTVVAVGVTRWDEPHVVYTTHSGQSSMKTDSWRAWARKSGARP